MIHKHENRHSISLLVKEIQIETQSDSITQSLDWQRFESWAASNNIEGLEGASEHLNFKSRSPLPLVKPRLLRCDVRTDAYALSLLGLPQRSTSVCQLHTQDYS